MLKVLIAKLRWGKLSPEQKQKLEILSLKEVFNATYLIRKY